MLNELRSKLSDKEIAALLDEVEQQFQEREKQFQDQKRMDADEIAILRHLSGTTEEEIKFRFAGQEKELARLKRALEEAGFKMKTILDKDTSLARENERLQNENDLLSQEAAKAKGRWEWSVQSLEREKKILSTEIQKKEFELKSLAEELTLATESSQKKSNEEKRATEEKLLNQMSDLLARQKWQILNEEKMLLQGFYTFVQNHLGGTRGSSNLILERVEQLSTPRPAGKKSFLGKMVSVFSELIRSHQFARQVQAELEVAGKSLRENVANVEKLQKGLNDFSSFLKMQDPQPQKIFLTEIAEEAVKSNDDLFKRNKISIKKNWKEVPPVFVDREMVLSALTEILMNAVDCQPAGGEIEISFEEDIGFSSVAVSVADRGPGVPPHLSEKIFEPFFTTKEGHSGLGLTRSFRWASLNGGLIEPRLQVGRGEFVLKFPIYKTGE